MAASRLPASEPLSPREGGNEDKCSRGHARDPNVIVETAVRRGRHCRKQTDMTNKDHKAEIHQRMAETGEPYAEARRKVIEARPRRQQTAEPKKIRVNYTLTLDGELEFDAAAWADALSDERKRTVEEAVAGQLDDDFAVYGAQGIAECIDRGELEFTTMTEAEIQAKYDAEWIEFASRVYAGIGEFDDWPGGVARPSASDSYAMVHQGVEYVVLRRKRSILAVYDVADGGFTALDTWPKEIETR